MAASLPAYPPIEACDTCGRDSLMTKQSLKQHIVDKDDTSHQDHVPYPDVTLSGRRLITSEEITSHTVSSDWTLDLGELHSGGITVMEKKANEELKHMLDEYFENNVQMDKLDMMLAMRCALDVVKHLLLHLGKERKGVKLSSREPAGSSFDGLKVAPPDEFDFLIPIELSGTDWEVVDGRTAEVDGNQLNAPGFYLIKKIATARTRMDSYLRKDGDYISPGNVIRDVQKKIHKIIRNAKNPKGVVAIKGGVKGPSIYLQVQYKHRFSGAIKTFDLDFVLEVRDSWNKDSPKLVAKRHPSVPQQGYLGDDPKGLLWQESSAGKEYEKIKEIPKECPKNCRKKCWKLVKALALRNKHLGSMCSYFYKTLFLHLLDAIPNDTEWEDTKLAERFLDFFKAMEIVLHRQQMPLYFTRDVNMLLPRYDSMQVENLFYYVRKLNLEGSHMQLMHGGLSAAPRKEKPFPSHQRKKRPPQPPTAEQLYGKMILELYINSFLRDLVAKNSLNRR